MFPANTWSTMKSPTIKILCCVGSSISNKIKSSIKEPTELSAQYTFTNKEVSFPISSIIGNTSIPLGISITSMIFTLFILYYKAKSWWVFLWMSLQSLRALPVCFPGLLLMFVSVKSSKFGLTCLNMFSVKNQ